MARDECPLCPPTARDAATTRSIRTCRSCGTPWFPAVPLDPDLLGEPAVDLERLARWLPTIAGRAYRFADGGHRDPTHGRSDFVDEEHRGLQRALAAMRHLDALARAGERSACAVLLYAYVHLGPEATAQYTKLGGLPYLVAKQFAGRERWAFWKSHKSRIVAHEGPIWHGQALLDDARAKWLGAARAPDEAGTAGADAPHAASAGDAVSLSAELDALLAALGRAA